MKINKLESQWLLPVLGCAALATSSQSNGSAIVEFKQVGADVVATWSGSIDLGTYVTYDSGSNGFQGYADSKSLVALNGSYYYYGWGLWNTTTLNGTMDSASSPIGFADESFFMPYAVEPTNGANIVDFDSLNLTHTFANDTLDNIGASSFNNTLAWSSGSGGVNDNIYYTTVIPEPSSVVMVGMGALALIVRRRR